MLSQHQHVAPDATPFALYMQKGKQGSHHFNKKLKSPSFNRFSPKTGFPYGNFNGTPRSCPHAHDFIPGRSIPSPQHTVAPLNGSSFNTSALAPCQIYGKTSHQALDCLHRMDYSYQRRHPSTQLVVMVAQTNTQLEE